jgi:hypothetical protein
MQTGKEGQEAYWNIIKEGVALNLIEFYLSKKSASKVANFNGRPLDCRIWGFFLIKATAKNAESGP